MGGTPTTSPDGQTWLALCRRAVAAQREVLAAYHSRASRSEEHGIGSGGDRPMIIDLLAEEAVFAELSGLDPAWNITALSEERGEVTVGDHRGDAEARWVIIDPLDGSFNAKRHIPAYATSIAVADGTTLADVRFAFVHDFPTGDEFVAERGAGAWLNGESLVAARPDDPPFEVIALESIEHDPVAMGVVASALSVRLGRPFRARVVGSTAIALCHLAAGRFDGFVSVGPCRTVDFAAAQLVAREAGRTVSFERGELREVGFEFERHHRFVGATSVDAAALLTAALHDAGPVAGA